MEMDLMVTCEQELKDLLDVKQSLLATVNGFGTDEEIAAAEAAIPEIDAEISRVQEAIAEGAVFVADGAEPQNQVSDLDGARFIASVDAVGVYEPDITSLHCAEGEAIVSSTPQGKPEDSCCDDAIAEKRSQSKKLGKAKKSEIPGMLLKELPGGASTLVVGPSEPPGGYPPLPTYQHVVDAARALNIDEAPTVVAGLWVDSEKIGEKGSTRCEWMMQELLKLVEPDVAVRYQAREYAYEMGKKYGMPPSVVALVLNDLLATLPHKDIAAWHVDIWKAIMHIDEEYTRLFLERLKVRLGCTIRGGDTEITLEVNR